MKNIHKKREKERNKEKHTSEPIRAGITTADDDMGTKTRKGEGCRKADAARATGDEHNLALELSLIVCRACRDVLDIIGKSVVCKTSRDTKEFLASRACGQNSRKNQKGNNSAHQSIKSSLKSKKKPVFLKEKNRRKKQNLFFTLFVAVCK